MLKFNTAGLLIPPTIIRSSIDEFEEYFAIASPDDVRRTLYKKYRIYTDTLKKLCGDIELTQWIDGSYVTKKHKPGDIDMVTFVNFKLAEKKANELKEFIYPGSLSNYGIDGYIVVVYPVNHKYHFVYNADCAYWINQFDRTTTVRSHKRIPKGFLEINV